MWSGEISIRRTGERGGATDMCVGCADAEARGPPHTSQPQNKRTGQPNAAVDRSGSSACDAALTHAHAPSGVAWGEGGDALSEGASGSRSDESAAVYALSCLPHIARIIAPIPACAHTVKRTSEKGCGGGVTERSARGGRERAAMHLFGDFRVPDQQIRAVFAGFHALVCYSHHCNTQTSESAENDQRRER